MNSISYLDSVLTRSLTTSRAGSGSTTPSNEGEGHRISRRASDYSLSRERERERRRIAVSLGLSALDAEQGSNKKRKSSKKGSKTSSTKGSDADSTPEKKRHGYSKAASESGSSGSRAKLTRTGSTPAPGRSSASSTRWGGLWGLGGWLDGSENHDAYPRRKVNSSYDEVIGKSLLPPSNNQRRASTSDAEAALAGISPESLLSEREKENVVDFEGYDPEEDLTPSPGSNAPPSTPFHTGTTTPTNERPRRTSRAGLSTGSRISSLLFGALNPLTDDYFGPQPSTGLTPPAHRRKRSEDGSSMGEKRRQKSFTKVEEQSTVKSVAEKMLLQVNDNEGQLSKDTHLPLEPPPPYSDIISPSSLLLPSPDLGALRGASGNGALRSNRRRRVFAIILRGVRGTVDFFQRLAVTILLFPVRIVRYYWQESSNGQEIVLEVTQGSNVKRQNSSTSKRFQTSSQAERPSASRHVAGRRRADYSESSDSEEIVTEEQAIEKAKRLAAKEKAEEEAVEIKTASVPSTPTTPIGGRLLPNPNPIDPLLAHDRHAKPSSPEALLQTSKAIQQVAAINHGPLSSLIHHSPKVLVLDLDETLIHSTSRSPTWSALSDKSKGGMAVTTGGGLLGLEGLGGMMGLRGQVGVRPHQVEVVLDGRSIIYHVYKRPHVDHFLRKVAAWYHVVIFTASVQEYADPVIDWLDQGRGLVGTRLFRESCTFRSGSYLKNLAHVDADLSRVCLVDNSPASYLINQANGIPIEGWTHDPNDEALLDLLPVLDSLRFAKDVRHILGLRGFLDYKQQNKARKV